MYVNKFKNYLHGVFWSTIQQQTVAPIGHFLWSWFIKEMKLLMMLPGSHKSKSNKAWKHKLCVASQPNWWHKLHVSQEKLHSSSHQSAVITLLGQTISISSFMECSRQNYDQVGRRKSVPLDSVSDFTAVTFLLKTVSWHDSITKWMHGHYSGRYLIHSADAPNCWTK